VASDGEITVTAGRVRLRRQRAAVAPPAARQSL